MDVRDGEWAEPQDKLLHVAYGAVLLCREKNRLVAEYALRGMANPMGVAEYQLLRDVPASLEAGLPSIDQIEAELGPDLSDSD